MNQFLPKVLVSIIDDYIVLPLHKITCDNCHAHGSLRDFSEDDREATEFQSDDKECYPLDVEDRDVYCAKCGAVYLICTKCINGVGLLFNDAKLVLQNKETLAKNKLSFCRLISIPYDEDNHSEYQMANASTTKVDDDRLCFNDNRCYVDAPHPTGPDGGQDIEWLCVFCNCTFYSSDK